MGVSHHHLRRLGIASLIVGLAGLSGCAWGPEIPTDGTFKLVEGEARVAELHAAEGMALLETRRGKFWAFWDTETQMAQNGVMLGPAPIYGTAPTFGQPSALARAPVSAKTEFPAREGDRIAFSGVITNREIYLRRVAVIK